MSDFVPIKDADDTTRKVDTFQRVEGADTVETQAVAIINPTTGDALKPAADGSMPVADAAVLTAVNTAAGSAGTGAPALDTGASGLLGWLRKIFAPLLSIDGKVPSLVGGRVPVDIGTPTITATISSEVEVKNDAGSPIPVAGTVALDAPTLAALENTTVTLSGPVALDSATLTALETVNIGNLPADPPTQTTLAAILAKIIAAPATEATLAAVLAKLIAAPATEATLGTLLTATAFNSRTPTLGAAAPSASSPVSLPLDTVVGAAASIAVINTNLLTGNVSDWYDASNFHSACIQIVGAAGISAGAIIFEQTNDTSAAAAGNVWAVEETTSATPTPNIAAVTIAASTKRMFAGAVMAKWVRVRVSTAFVGGNVQAIAVFSQLPYQRTIQTVHQATAGNFNGTMTVSGNPVLGAGANLIGDVGLQLRGNATGAATLSKFTAAATSNAANIKASAGRVVGWHLYNTTASVKYFRFFNLAVAPTMGTSAPYFVVPVPANGASVVSIPAGIAFGTGISIACTGGVDDLDNTATAANDVLGFIAYA